MATVYDVKLERKDKPAGIGEITVSYKVSFNYFERNTKVQFKEYIELWGLDVGETYPAYLPLSIQPLYSAPSGTFFSQSTPLTRTRKFDIADKLLDEDVLSGQRDEVYAIVRVVPYVPSTSAATSNVITGYF